MREPYENFNVHNFKVAGYSGTVVDVLRNHDQHLALIRAGFHGPNVLRAAKKYIR